MRKMDSRRESCYLLLAAGAGREDGPLIWAAAALGRLIWWSRYRREASRRDNVKPTSVGFSGLPTDLGGPIYTDPLPPNVLSSGQERKTDAAWICLRVLCYIGGTGDCLILNWVKGQGAGLSSTIGMSQKPHPLKLFHLSGIFF